MRLISQKMGLRPIGIVLLLWSFSAQVHAAMDWTFSTNNTTGAPGSTVGWGYTITNLDTVNWLSLTGLSVDPFLHGTPQLIFDYPNIAPNSSLSVPYDGSAGLYQFTWDANAPLGYTHSGLFTLSAEWYIGEPYMGGVFVGVAPERSASYTATATVVPLPAAWMLFASGFAGLALLRRRRISQG